MQLNIYLVDEYMNLGKHIRSAVKMFEAAKYIALPIVIFIMIAGNSSYAASPGGVMGEIGYIKALLSQVGPALSATLFIVAGIFYAVGQMLPPDKKANFHTTSINIIIGAIVVAILSVASTALASASSHLLTNMTIANMSS